MLTSAIVRGGLMRPEQLRALSGHRSEGQRDISRGSSSSKYVAVVCSPMKHPSLHVSVPRSSDVRGMVSWDNTTKPSEPDSRYLVLRGRVDMRTFRVQGTRWLFLARLIEDAH